MPSCQPLPEEGGACIHGVWPATSCTIGSGRDSLVLERLIIVGRWKARFHGKCARCGDDIAVGEPIAQDTEDNYLCEGCST